MKKLIFTALIVTLLSGCV
ncbi:lipoprotein, partial [Vibrio parahaemolyticus]